MKKSFTIIVSFFLLFFIANIAHSQEDIVNLYYSNGILADYYKAGLSLDALENRLVGANIDGKIVYEVSHNETKNGLLDFFQCVDQKIQLGLFGGRRFWDFLSGINPMPIIIKAELLRITRAYNESMVKWNPEIENHVKIYNEKLCAGEKVIVVSHSQGNLYSNIAFGGINKSVIDGFGLVSVATPASKVEGDGRHTNIIEDFLMNQVPGGMGANLSNYTDNGNVHPDGWIAGHFFTTSYLDRGRNAEKKIIEDIEERLDRLEWPEEGMCERQFALVGFHTPGGDYRIVWDIGKNDYAQITDNNDNPVVYPVLYNDISNFMRTTLRVGKKLYSNPQSCVDYGTAGNCDFPPGGGECSDSNQTISSCPDIYGQYTLVNEGTITKSHIPHINDFEAGDYEFYRNQIIRSYKNTETFNILNSITGITTCRVEAVYDQTLIINNHFDQTHNFREDIYDLKMITPLGSLGSWQLLNHNEFSYNWPEYDDVFGRNFTEEYGGFHRSIIGQYSEKALVQFFTLEIQKESTLKPCGKDFYSSWWAGSDPIYFNSKPCPSEVPVVEAIQEFEVIASADIVESGADQDPRQVNRNPEFEAAIKSLYESCKNYLAKPIPSYVFSLYVLEEK